MYSCLTDDGCFKEKVKCINKCLTKHKIKFKDYKNVFAAEVNKIKNNDDTR